VARDEFSLSTAFWPKPKMTQSFSQHMTSSRVQKMPNNANYLTDNQTDCCATVKARALTKPKPSASPDVGLAWLYEARALAFGL
jgi:hypothetical protein